MKRLLRHLVLASAASLLLAGCGFHLRGLQEATKLNASSIYLEPTSDYVLDVELRRLFSERSGIPVAAQAADAPLRLRIANENRDKLLRSIGADGHAKQYELRYSLTYKASDARGVVVGERQISLSRSMSYSDNEVLAKEQEEKQIYTEMRSDALYQMLRQLSVLDLSGNAAPANTTP